MAKFEIKPDKNSIIVGIQGGHQLQEIKQNYISPFDPVLEKIITLQKKANQQNFYQSILLQTRLNSSLLNLLSSKKIVLEELMDGAQFQFKFNLLSKLDDIFFSMLKYYEETAGTEKKHVQKADDPEKEN